MAFLRSASASLLLLALLGCGGEGSVSNAAHLRFFDAFSDQSNVRLTVGGRTYSAGGASIENGDDPKYGSVPSGTVDLTVQTYDRSTTLATLTSQNLVEGANYTAVASTVGSTKRIALYRDGATPATGAAVIRVVNAYTGNTSVFLRLFKDSDNSLAYQTNTTASSGLASGGTTGFQSVSEDSTDGASYTLRVYDANDFGVEIGSRTITLKTGTAQTFFLYNRRSSTNLAIKAATDRTASN